MVNADREAEVRGCARGPGGARCVSTHGALVARPAAPAFGQGANRSQLGGLDAAVAAGNRSRLAAVVKDEKLSEDQKDAMLDGFRRMERGQVFKLLTPEQQKEVRERVRARRAAEQEEKKKRQSLRE